MFKQVVKSFNSLRDRRRQTLEGEEEGGERRKGGVTVGSKLGVPPYNRAKQRTAWCPGRPFRVVGHDERTGSTTPPLILRPLSSPFYNSYITALVQCHVLQLFLIPRLHPRTLGQESE